MTQSFTTTSRLGMLYLAASLPFVPARIAAQTISIAERTPMHFGSFAAGSGGSIILSPEGSRTPVGGLVLVNPSGKALVSAAAFTVRGAKGLAYTISFGEGPYALTGPNSATMALGNFTYSPSPSQLVLPNSGSQTVSVGATLSVLQSQAAGNYSGTYIVTVQYQ
jgi:hypothetical protein